jgi:hypothetical protein
MTTDGVQLVADELDFNTTTRIRVLPVTARMVPLAGGVNR